MALRGCRHDEADFQTLAIPDAYLQGVGAGEIRPIFMQKLVGPRLFVDAIRRDYQPEPSFVQGFKVQQALEAALRSHQTGQRMLIES